MHGRAARRLDEIERQVPDLIDMLVVTLEAGLGFGASMDVSSTRMRAPIGDEIRLTMQEQSMGLGMPEALTNTLARVDTPNMSAFVRSVVQGNALGISMGVVMRNLAADMRVRRRQQAEERAHKAPVKMLFPLIFLMFPALGVVILGPAMFEITEQLGGRDNERAARMDAERTARAGRRRSAEPAPTVARAGRATRTRGAGGAAPR